MAVAIYQFARFEPEFPCPLPTSAPTPQADSLDVERPAPEGVGRSQLRSRISRQQLQPNDAFGAFTVTHDDVGHYDAYDEPDADDVVRHYYVYPKDYFAYERNASPGEVYVKAPILVVKELFRRYRTTMTPANAAFRQRVVDLRGLEATLEVQMHAESGAYTLGNVESDTAITRLVVRGQQIAANNEVQDLKRRAESINVLEFGLQHGEVVLQMSVDERGAVKFARTPGDAPALDVLDRLEPYILKHSELVAVAVGQGGGG